MKFYLLLLLLCFVTVLIVYVLSSPPSPSPPTSPPPMYTHTHTHSIFYPISFFSLHFAHFINIASLFNSLPTSFKLFLALPLCAVFFKIKFYFFFFTKLHRYPSKRALAFISFQFFFCMTTKHPFLIPQAIVMLLPDLSCLHRATLSANIKKIVSVLLLLVKACFPSSKQLYIIALKQQEYPK